MNNVISRVEIEEWLRDISYIILDLNIAVQNSERLAENKYDFEIEIKRHGFFKHHWYQLRFISIIQLCKLLSENSNEKRSFHKLFNRLERDSYDPDLTELLLSNKFEIIHSKNGNNYRCSRIS